MRYFYGDKFEVFSAGARKTYVHPVTVEIMKEIGIDISKQRSKSVKEFSGQEFDYVITLCGDYANDMCPAFIGKAKQRLHWNFPDPAEAKGNEKEILFAFRKARDEIKDKIDEFVKDVVRI